MLTTTVACTTATAAPPPPPATSSRASPPPTAPVPQFTAAVTEKAARRIHDRYWRLITRSAPTGGTGLSDAEAGLALQLTRAHYRIQALQGVPVARPRRVTSVRFYIPHIAPGVGGSPWFVSDLRRAGGGRTQMVYALTRSGWRVIAGTATRTTSLPRIALDSHGLATPISADAAGLSVSPRRVARAHASILSLDPRATSAQDDGEITRIVGPAAYTTQAAADTRAEQRALRGQWTMAIDVDVAPTLYALRTHDGGAVVWYALRERLIVCSLTNRQPISFNRPSTAALSKGRLFHQQAMAKAAGWYVAAIPPASSSPTATGRATILGDWHSYLSVTDTVPDGGCTPRQG
ncbi:hypothetical protein HS048_34515 [Planomonospora sp. ID91781]|uniref:hypothetical protein n=1 Tax=Planomonospora sp. ID91781 TaxID=2738135 RepID=UPI0018C3AA81|nr:hypothetical protein [Planomonospora sp. ID91781]MBG0825799.1 hypothetical protein [Planomonospora sp. ID91781]